MSHLEFYWGRKHTIKTENEDSGGQMVSKTTTNIYFPVKAYLSYNKIQN